MSNNGRGEYKLAWQRAQRRAFAREKGFSTSADRATGGLRESVLERDGYSCVRCGMTDAQHRQLWGRPITVDHKDRDRSHNTMDNLQTLCLRCHGSKDLSPRLRAQVVPEHKQTILRLRATGATYQAIADSLGFSIASIWKWVRKWESEAA